MITVRPGRTGVEAERLRLDAGTHFDPALVPVFLARLPEVLAVRAQHMDVA